jgi:hypothetical protein
LGPSGVQTKGIDAVLGISFTEYVVQMSLSEISLHDSVISSAFASLDSDNGQILGVARAEEVNRNSEEFVVDESVEEGEESHEGNKVSEHTQLNADFLDGVVCHNHK